MTNKRTYFMQEKYLILFKIYFSFFIAFLFSTTAWAAVELPLKPYPDHSKQCISIVDKLEKYHYLKKNLNNNQSAIILERYIKRLDPGKQLFTAKDIKQFRKHQFRLDNELNDGDVSTGFKMFNLYMERSILRLEHTLSLINGWEKNLDFTKDDSIIVDNDLRKWKTSTEELYDMWKKALKNHIITLRLEDKDNATITNLLDKTYSSRMKRLMQIDANDCFEIYMNSVTTSFDPHTNFMSPRESERFDISMSKSLEGIGAVLQNEYEFTKVVRLISKGPADKSNLLMPGDKIIGVGQGKTGEIKDILGQRLDHVVKLIRGPKNSFVRLKIIPAKKNNTTRTIQIKRGQVTLEEQSAQKKVMSVDRNGKTFKIGIIEIPNFYFDSTAYRKGDKNYKSTTRDVKKLLGELKKENISGLIIDLRNNGGGFLDEANNLTSLFLRSGPTVQIRYKYKIERLYDDDRRIEYSGPLVVLINRMSASASEIFAGAIQDYNRGIIVGTKSFGKGTVQQLMRIEKGMLKLTNGKFYRVSGESNQHVGIEPDLKYPQIYKTEDVGESSYEGALHWDIIRKTSFNAYRPMNNILEKLNTSYQNRSLHDPGVNFLKEKIKLTDQINSQTTIPLNLEKRKSRREHYEQMELDIENDYLTSMGKPQKETIDQKEAIDPKDENQEDENRIDYKKILMDQTMLVMADFIGFSNNLGYTW